MKALTTRCALALGLLALLGSLAAAAVTAADSLYIGDASDDSVKRFDAETGAFLGTFVSPGSGGVDGPRGLLFTRFDTGGCDSLLVVNQNVHQTFSGEIFQYDGGTGAFLKALVPAANPHAPFAPRGMVLWDDKVLFVADQGNVPAPGRLLAYTKDGQFLADFTPSEEPDFYPRGMVIGPDGKLYVAVRNFEFCGGSVMRFDPATHAFLGVFVTNPPSCDQNVNDLHRPEALVFGPDENLYLTSHFRDGTDTDKIVIFQGPNSASPGTPVGNIVLDDISLPEEAAATLLFGPDGRLFVPISNIDSTSGTDDSTNGPGTGAVRRYSVDTKTFDVFVPSHDHGGPLGVPWYLTFGSTDPATLAYDTQLSTCALTPAPTPTLPPQTCVGDCDASTRVTVDEILTLVNIALGNAQVSDCSAGDANGDHGITVDEILAAVDNALNGCGQASPTPRVSGTCVGRPDGATCDAGTDSPRTMVCSNAACVQCTANSGASPRFVDNGDGTITDRNTCLVWEKKDSAEGIHDLRDVYVWSTTGGTPAPEGVTFATFIVALQSVRFAGHSDWRLPTSAGSEEFPTGEPAEIESIADMSACGSGGLCVAAIFNTNCGVNGGGNAGCTVDGAGATEECSCTALGEYWSSTPDATNPSYAYSFDPTRGHVGVAYKTNIGYVRAVRGGA